MKKKGKVGAALVCPESLVREQLRIWSLIQRDGTGGHARGVYLSARPRISLMVQMQGAKKGT